MAYGKNRERKRWLMRAVPLGVGEMTPSKRAALFDLRSRVLALMRTMAAAGFSPEPLAESVSGQDLEARLLIVQKACEGLNSVWREQTRMRVKPALEEINRRYRQRLVGSLRFVDQKIPADEQQEGERRTYFNIPAEVQEAVTAQEIAALKALIEHKEAIEAFRRVIVGNDTTGFTDRQIAILRFIHARSLDKHRVPEFGAARDFTLQLHLDSRMLPTGQKAEAQALRDGATFLLEDKDNRRYHRFLELAGVAPRDARLRLPLVLTQKIAKSLETTKPDWASLIVEISEHRIGVRLVAGKPPPAVRGDAIFRVVGRDFGYTNTISLSVAESLVAPDLDAFRTGLEALKEEDAVRRFLDSRALPQDVKIIARVRYSGRAFIERVARLCRRIDGYRSKIDLAYHRLEALKQEIAQALGLAEGEFITRDMKASLCSAKVREFFATFGLIHDLKRARAALYRKVAQIKKNWFGYLANLEVQLARDYGAALAREDLTVQAIEKDSPEYKGRAFNKLINHGSKGQYQRRATDKLQWNGVPEVVIPSWYTSRACLPHAVIVEKKHRKGERIYLPCCAMHEHADEHAADTIASYLFLRPRLTGPTGSVCDNRPLGALP